MPDKFNWPVADEADDRFCAAWFLLGVEHTIDLFCNDNVALFDVFRSDLLARTAVGLTG